MSSEAIELTRRMIELQEQQTAALAELTRAIHRFADNQKPVAINVSELAEEMIKYQGSSVNLGVVNHLPDLPVAQKVALPSKMELAKQWLKEHPEDRILTGRELAENRFPHGVVISYVYWNKAKNEV